jgi:hypothetical protein
VSEPSAPITRWQGTTIETGFFAFAAPTARTASGLPIVRASAAYVTTTPRGMRRSAS